MMHFFLIFLLFMPKYEGSKKVSFLSIPEVGEKKNKKKKKKVGENNSQLRFRPPPRVVHTSCLDQNKSSLIFALY